MRRIFRASGLVAAAVMLAGCAAYLGDDDDPLTGPTWTLRSLQRVDGTPVALPPGVFFTVRFGEDGRASIRADCNGCWGAYEADGRQISLGALACTRAFCTRSAPVDTDYARALEAARSYVMEGETLTLSGERSLLVFER